MLRALLLVALVACETGSPPTGEARLIAHYPMDDLVAGKVTDITGNGHHGMCTTCPPVEAGKIGSGYNFDGGDQQIDIPADAAFNTGRAMSVAAFVKLDTAPPTVAGCAAVRGNAWQLCITPALAPAFGSLTGTGSVTLGAFHHVAIIWDGTNKRIALDGAEVLSQAGTVGNDPAGITLGAELIGVVDDVRIYDGALTDEQLATIAMP